MAQASASSVGSGADRHRFFEVCEDQLTLTFMDIFSVEAGHSLVIPKTHYENIYTIPPDTLAELSPKLAAAP